MTKTSGTCLCGGVTLSTGTTLDKFGACHCGLCRKGGGGPYLEVECKSDVEIDGKENISVFDSSKWAERGFCKKCGTHLFYRLKQIDQYHVPLGLFGDSISPTFDAQVFIDQKPDNYSFNEKTTNYTEAQIFEMFGAPE